MDLQEHEIKSTRYYQLINMASEWALYIPSISKYYTEEKAYLAESNEESLGQIWQIVQLDLQDKVNYYEIVHSRSTLVLTKIRGGEVRLKFGEWLNSQKFELRKVQGKPGIFQFVNNESKKGYLCYTESELKILDIEPENTKSHWYIKPCLYNQIISRSCYFSNSLTHLSIDVPKASLETGCEIIQYSFNNRFNQRFNIYLMDKFYMIGSLNSKLFVSCHKKCREGDKITQEDYDEKDKRQRWELEYQGRGLYLIRSHLDKTMFIGSKDKEKSIRGIPLVTTTNEDRSLWKIVGHIPKEEKKRD